MRNVTNATFDAEVVKASFNEPIVALFFGPNCRPCAVLKPILQEVSQDSGITVVGIDAALSRSLVQEFGLRMVPTLIVFKNGEAVATRTGAATDPELRSWLAAAGVPAKVNL